MRVLLPLFLICILLSACSSANRTNQPEGITGTTGTSTSGTGTAAPSGTVGTGSTAPPVGPDQVVPKAAPNASQNDDAITAVVKKRLTDTGFSQIDVETTRGVVTLSGTVSRSQVDELIREVQTIPEVQSVSSNLTVE